MGVPDATGEGPSSGEEVATIDGDGGPHGGEHTGGPGRAPAGKDLIDGVTGQEGADASEAGGADHEAPAGGGIDLADGFQNVKLGNEVSLGSAQHMGELEAEQAGVIQGIDRIRRKGSSLLALPGASLEDWANTLDGVHQDAPLLFAIEGEGSRLVPGGAGAGPATHRPSG